MKRTYLLAFLAVSAVTFSKSVYAQEVSDADKNAARQLFVEGDGLQKGGKPQEALDRYERSYRVFRAPTTILRIAQCQAALGRLVEADESYREASRFELRSDASAAFQNAKAQALTEGQALSPRVPALRIDISPPGLRGVLVTIDDQPLNEALIGVARPLNPGAHRIAATAPGYMRLDQIVQVKERQKDAAVLLEMRLVQQGAPTPTPTPTPPTPTPTPTPTAGQPAPITNPDGSLYVAPPKKASEASFFYGGRVGYQATLDSDGNPYAGYALGAEAALRFAKYITVSTVLDIGRVSYTGSATTGASTFISSERTFVRAAVYGGFISSPDGPVGVWAQLGASARFESGDYGDSDSGTSVSLSLGVPIKFSNFRILPRVDIDPAHSVAFIGLSGLIEVGGSK